MPLAGDVTRTDERARCPSPAKSDDRTRGLTSSVHTGEVDGGHPSSCVANFNEHVSNRRAGLSTARRVAHHDGSDAQAHHENPYEPAHLVEASERCCLDRTASAACRVTVLRHRLRRSASHRPARRCQAGGLEASRPPSSPVDRGPADRLEPQARPGITPEGPRRRAIRAAASHATWRDARPTGPAAARPRGDKVAVLRASRPNVRAPSPARRSSSPASPAARAG